MLRKKASIDKSIFKSRIMFFPLIFIIGGLFLIVNDMGAFRWYKLREERNQIRSEIDLYIQNEIELAQELDKLTNDTAYIKKIAQEKFHMVKPGEKVFRVIDRKKTN